MFELVPSPNCCAVVHPKLNQPMAFMTFAENLTKSLEPMLASYSATLLQKISEDYKLPYEELSQKYLTGSVSVPLPKAKAPVKKKSSKVELPQCSGLTAKGGQCTHKAFDESGLCRIHQKKADPTSGKATVTKEPKEKKKKEPKKVKKGPPPEHTHEVGESSDQCGLCESHGNPMNPELPSTTFESDGLAERLKALIMAEGEPEDEEIPVAEPISESIDEESEETVVLAEEEESDYEDEGEALTQALRNLVMQE
jgi:hypothetical protein